MSSSPTSSHNPRFAIIALVVMVLSVSVFVLTSGGVLPVLARTAYNQHRDHLAVEIWQLDRPTSAGELTDEAKALLEADQTSEALRTAKAAHIADPNNSETTLILAASESLNGQRLTAEKLEGSQTPSETAEGVKKLTAGNLALAQELYALGLLRSSQRVLASTAASLQRSLLQAQITIELQPGRRGAKAALPYAKAAVAQNPASRTAQQLYISVSQETGNHVAAETHEKLLQQL